jgi:hypothetical protein
MRRCSFRENVTPRENLNNRGSRVSGRYIFWDGEKDDQFLKWLESAIRNEGKGLQWKSNLLTTEK